MCSLVRNKISFQWKIKQKYWNFMNKDANIYTIVVVIEFQNPGPG